MTPERWQKIQELFYAALEREPNQRAAFLGEACAGDESLRSEVESLLAAHGEVGSTFEALPGDVAAKLLVEDKARQIVGRTLGRYQILSQLGAGGMGEVYCALDTELDREVAIKVLPPRLANDPEALQRFRREAKAVAALSHPNILAIHDFGTEEGVSYAVMELLKGETLRSRLAQGALPWRKAVAIGVEIADGLSAAHTKGITHRDLKPENIFLTSDGRTKILDFGLAQIKQESATENITSAQTEPLMTAPGLVMGTIGYMSPEQLRGQKAAAASDIFSFGCVLYEMISGLRAFRRETAWETNAAILREDPPELAGPGKNIPAELERVVTHCLEKNLGERFQSAQDLSFALRAITSGTGNTKIVLKPNLSILRSGAPLAVALLFLLFGLALYLHFHSDKNASLVVLPFANGDSDPDKEYLSDGITENIINTLSQLPQLRVIARTTAFTYKGRAVDPKRVGEELGVRTVLTGKAIFRGDVLTVQADLIDVTTGSEIWGEKYNRKFSDIFAVQEEIARDISERLRLRLTGEQQQRLIKRPTQNTEAYQLYWKGRFHWETRKEEGLLKAIDYFKQAVEKDPNFALAYAGLADAYIIGESPLKPTETMRQAKEAATTALKLDNMLSEAHTSLAAVKMLYEWDWPGAESEFRRAIDLKPSYATAHHWYAEYLTAMGRHEDAFSEIKRTQELDPKSLTVSRDVGRHYYFARWYDRAITQFQNTLDLDQSFSGAHTFLGLTYVKKGMFVEAVAELQRAVDLSGSGNSKAMLAYAYALAGQRSEAKQILDSLRELPKEEYVSPLWITAIYSGLGDKEQAFTWLERAYEEHSSLLIYIKVYPILDGLRSDVRLLDLEKRIGLSVN